MHTARTFLSDNQVLFPHALLFFVVALMAFAQISVNIQFNCDIKFPLNYQKMLDTLAIANLDLIPSLGMQCWLNEFDC